MCWVTVLPLAIGANFLLKVQCVRLRGVWDDIFIYLYSFLLSLAG